MDEVDTRRVYYQDERFFVFENLNTSSPVLVSREHAVAVIPAEAFAVLKGIASKLFGSDYALIPSRVEDDHYHIKVIRLTPVED